MKQVPHFLHAQPNQRTEASGICYIQCPQWAEASSICPTFSGQRHDVLKGHLPEPALHRVHISRSRPQTYVDRVYMTLSQHALVRMPGLRSISGMQQSIDNMRYQQCIEIYSKSNTTPGERSLRFSQTSWGRDGDANQAYYQTCNK